MYSSPNFEPVHCSISSSDYCFLTCTQVSQEVGKVICYSHLFKSSPQGLVIHTIEGFCIVSKAEVDVFLEFPCFFYDPTDVGNLISGSSAFSKSSFVHLEVLSSRRQWEVLSSRRQWKLAFSPKGSCCSICSLNSAIMFLMKCAIVCLVSK